MAEFSRLVITGKGQALIAKIMTGKGNITFTKVSASNAECVLEQLESLAELSDIRQTVPVSKISRTNEVAITIESVFNNLELTEGYHMRALGLYAADPDEGEILYAVTMEISGSCYMPAYNGVAVSEAYIKLVTTVGNSENVSLEVDLAAVVTVGDMNSLREEIVREYLPKTGDSAENTVEFESNDSENATSWTDVPIMGSKEKHKSLFEKVSIMFKNVRFLYKILGSEDISQVGDGTVTGILQELKRVALTGSYNDLGDTPNGLPASDVYPWAKQPTKPSYDKSDVGLGNVTNTSDTDKPVSTAQQQALDGKVNITSILETIEQVDANTSAKNIADALVIKALKADLINSINQINSNFANKNAKNAFTVQQEFKASAPVTPDLFMNAALAVIADTSVSGNPASFALHNGGREATAIYLDLDGRIKAIMNHGPIHTFAYETAIKETALIDLGTMPEAIESPKYYDFPEGYTSENSVVIGVRVVRNNGYFVYGNDSKACNIIYELNRISVYATEYGIQYCAGAPMSCLLAKVY